MSTIKLQKMPDHVDRRIKRSIRYRFIGDFASEYIFSRMTFALGMGVFVFMFLSSQSQFMMLQKENELYASVLDNMARQTAQDSRSIVHMKMHVEEGVDKSLVVARLNEIDPSITAQVPMRSEDVELWQHGTSVMTVVRSDLPQQPTRAFMNLERDDHVHVLRYEPESCSNEDASLRSPGCEKDARLSDEQQAHRTLFDSVHNIESDYQELLAVHTKPFTPLDFEPMNFDRVEKDHVVLVANVQKDLKREYRFTKNTLQLSSVHTFLELEGEWYEMSVIRYEFKENLEPQKFNEVFDPVKYPLEQTELIKLI